MRKIIDSVLKLPYTIFYGFVHAVLAVVKPIEIARLRTYYPEKKRKPIIERYFDCLKWRVRNKDSNCFYTLYGLDCEGADEKNYVPETLFWRQLTKMNGLLPGNEYCHAGSQVYYLRDKLAFFFFMQLHKFPVPKVRYLIKDGKYYDLNMNEVSIEEIAVCYKDFFVKDLNGQCASFVKHIGVAEDLGKYSNLKKGLYILQDAVRQSDEMNNINPRSINTLRIITINKDGHPYVFSSILRVGTAHTGNVDNWAAGGLAVGINGSGNLSKYGFYKPKYGTKTDVHPDTGVVFSDISLGKSFLEACRLCCLAHSYLYNIHSIGWDVALTDEGPVFIEGNDNWEISLLQACNGGLKEKWNEAIANEEEKRAK